MTTLQVERELGRLSRKELCRLHEAIEDLIDTMDAKAAKQRMAKGEKGIPWQKLKKELDAKWSTPSTK